MKAPAKRVAVSRAAVNVANIEKPLFQSGLEPDHRVRAFVIAKGVPN
jgi:hypothetical protein